MPSSSKNNPKLNPFTSQLVDALRRHPKRVVFAEGEDLRVLQVAERLVELEAVVPILLGNKARIRRLAEENGINMTFVNVIDPEFSSDFPLFCKRYEKMSRYRGAVVSDVEGVVKRPHFFAALMVQYGQADAVLAGNQGLPANYFRALLGCIKPKATVPKVFGIMALIGEHLSFMGGSGVLFFADCGLIPQPTVEQLAAIAVETGSVARHLLRRKPLVAMISHSTKGSANTEDARRVVAATSRAKQMIKQQYLDIDLEGELQADVALDPQAAEVKIQNASWRQSADVLVFPNLDASHAAMKLLQHVAGAQGYGQLIKGFIKPAAQVPRTADFETIFGTTLVLAIEAIESHKMIDESEEE